MTVLKLMPTLLRMFMSRSCSADQNGHDLQGDTPLHLAAANGHADTIKGLIELLADPRATNGQVCVRCDHSGVEIVS